MAAATLSKINILFLCAYPHVKRVMSEACVRSPYSLKSRRGSHIAPTHVLGDNCPTPFKIVLTYTSTSRVNAFRRLLVPLKTRCQLFILLSMNTEKLLGRIQDLHKGFRASVHRRREHVGGMRGHATPGILKFMPSEMRFPAF